jgi:large subunit ribosomal protein L29
MKAQEIRELSLEDLKDRLAAESEAMNNLTLTHAVSELENPMQIRTKRRLVARLKTEVTARENVEQA